jgi:transposase
LEWLCLYRALLEKHFPNAKIVADRFHVIRLINHHFSGLLAGNRPGEVETPRAVVPDAAPPRRQAYGFRNFGNYRLRVRVMCR